MKAGSIPLYFSPYSLPFSVHSLWRILLYFCLRFWSKVHNFVLVETIVKLMGGGRCSVDRGPGGPWLKCTKFAFCWGSTANPTGGTYSTPSDPIAVFKGPIFKQRKGKGNEGKGEGTLGRGGGGRDLACLKILVWRPLCLNCTPFPFFSGCHLLSVCLHAWSTLDSRLLGVRQWWPQIMIATAMKFMKTWKTNGVG